ncbi:unnamed protein product [Leptidea sinapis]|uniref:Major facilitator superfamily (MFS) profile domain-containing protein n=1 Tax=Leptidea sinapis TaxID=189913 RepID=A0A5E4Q3X5_9NEOP|nr:unnamed protein product [Leptidea sinapis]
MILFYSTTITEIIICQVIIGVLPGAIVTVSIMIYTEYTSPKYRGVFLTVKAATFFWGIWVANVIGAFFYWKNIAIVMFVCCALSSTIFFWPESPMWLASKGRFDECALVHRWLNGHDPGSEKELSSLIKLHKAKLSNVNEKKSIKNEFRKYMEAIKMKTFYKPILLSVLTGLLYICSGKLACSAYAITIIKKITTSEEAAYNGMLILDGFTILGIGLSTSVVIILVYKYLPETKDKTVPEIHRLIVENAIELPEESAEEKMYVFKAINDGDARNSYLAIEGDCIEKQDV